MRLSTVRVDVGFHVERWETDGWLLLARALIPLLDYDVTEGAEDVEEPTCLRVCLGAICHNRNRIPYALVCRCIDVQQGKFVAHED